MAHQLRPYDPARQTLAKRLECANNDSAVAVWLRHSCAVGTELYDIITERLVDAQRDSGFLPARQYNEHQWQFSTVVAANTRIGLPGPCVTKSPQFQMVGYRRLRIPR